MECLHPVLLRRSPFQGLPGYEDPGRKQYVPCGKCLACRINRRREWTQRLLHESNYNSTSYFITITYDSEHVPINCDGLMEVCKKDIQLFHRYIRRNFPDVTFRYFLNSEYGPQTQRPHYHAIYYGLPESVFTSGIPKYGKRGLEYTYNGELQRIWSKGELTVSPMTRERASYCAKYFIDKLDNPDFTEKNFNLMSRKPGIGRLYAEAIAPKVRHYGLIGCLTDKGNYVGLPRYYRKVIYSDDERREQFESREYDSTYMQKFNGILNNGDIMESNLHRAMTFKGKKSKL